MKLGIDASTVVVPIPVLIGRIQPPAFSFHFADTNDIAGEGPFRGKFYEPGTPRPHGPQENTLQ